MKSLYYIIFLFIAATLTSCDDNDSFSSDPSHVMSFQKDVINLDTIFDNTLSSYKMIKVFNNSGDGLRITSVRQTKGYDKTGFMVNVNGSFIDPEQNNILRDLEVRKGDSIRIFVEAKPLPMADTDTLKEITDQVVFTYESGTTQTLNLKALAWNADTLNWRHIKSGETFTINKEQRPYVVYGILYVDEGATLNITEGSRVFFHQDGNIRVEGKLNIQGKKGSEVILQCDRLDSLLQLRYDNVPGKWGGILLMPKSAKQKNTISYMDLHGGIMGVYCDSTNVAIDHSTIHNIKGRGITAYDSDLDISNTQISNTKDRCISISGGTTNINYCTIASFYCYDSGKDTALVLTDKTSEGKETPLTFNMKNSIVTGYLNDEVQYNGIKKDSVAQGMYFDHCLLRTTRPTTKDSVLMMHCIFENTEDTITGREKNFKTIDLDFFEYDFSLRETSKAIGLAEPDPAITDDRKGNARKTKPDAGCFESTEEKKE